MEHVLSGAWASYVMTCRSMLWLLGFLQFFYPGFSPGNADLYRLYGACLFSQGNKSHRWSWFLIKGLWMDS